MGKLNQPLHTVGHTLFPSSCTHFSSLILKLSWQAAHLPLESLCWDIINSQKLYSWGCKPSEISDFASISLNLYHWIHNYFTFKYILQILHPTKHLYLYHLHTSQEIPNTHTKSPSHGRHKSILHKALLLEGTSTPYKSSPHERQHYSWLHNN